MSCYPPFQRLGRRPDGCAHGYDRPFDHITKAMRAVIQTCWPQLYILFNFQTAPSPLSMVGHRPDHPDFLPLANSRHYDICNITQRGPPMSKNKATALTNEQKIKNLRAAIIEGEASGPATAFDIDSFISDKRKNIHAPLISPIRLSLPRKSGRAT